MKDAYCAGKNPRHWESDFKLGPAQGRAKKACEPCHLHQMCAAYAISIPEQEPVGVIIAGVAMGEDRTDRRYQASLNKLKQIAKGEDNEPEEEDRRMIAAELRPVHRGMGLVYGSQSGTIQAVRSTAERGRIDMLIDLMTPHGVKSIVLSPSTEVELRGGM